MGCCRGGGNWNLYKKEIIRFGDLLTKYRPNPKIQIKVAYFVETNQYNDHH